MFRHVYRDAIRARRFIIGSEPAGSFLCSYILMLLCSYALIYPFTAPAIRPFAKYFWKKG